MREFLTFVVRQLVGQNQEFVLKEQTQGPAHIFLLSLPAAEIGKIIGKQGQTIKAIRCLLENASTRSGQRAVFEIEEQSPSN